MKIITKGDTSKFLSLGKKEQFEQHLIRCKTDQDFQQVKAEQYFAKGYAFTMKKTDIKIYVDIMTEKEAKRVELKMKLRNKINQKKYGGRDMRKKIKNEKKIVDKHIFKKYMKVIKGGYSGANILSPSDIMNDVDKYSQLVSMMSHPSFSKNKIVQEYYETMREHIGLPEFKMPEMKAEQHGNIASKAGPIESESKADITNEQDTEEEDEETSVKSVSKAAITNEQDTEE